ncbi:VanZ family protein [Anaeromicropila populeti]|uniref:Glycopeptide antibiotics resistance protein n=1 Tax=Anaeromicropila populeti TaxID=37658 RepID=A0A1I6HRY7_9FIRM|nr:VanZ family protein [Anaeromicropila populeti]SFR57040.1 Glycopeptide antibiotics resistance protein [Anaeromicropila populeti]
MEKQNKIIIKNISRVLFVIYIITLLYFLFFSEGFNRSEITLEYRYNLEFLKEVKRSFWCLRAGNTSYFVINFLGNIAAFVPFGFAVPLIGKKKNFFYVLFLTIEFTIFVELLQLVLRVGSFDVDDIFLNTLGGILGYIIFFAAKLLFGKHEKGGRK